MATFEYIAFDAKSKRVKGVVEGDSNRQVRQQLRDKGFIPIEVHASNKESAGPSSLGFSLIRTRRINSQDRVLITRQLSTLIASGLPLEEALQAVAQQSEKQYLTTLLMSIRSKVLELSLIHI